MKCQWCKKETGIVHKNKKYCSSVCMNKSRYARSGIRSTREQRSEWYKKRCEQKGYIEKLRKQANKRNKDIKRFLAEYKIEKGCKDCGYKKHHSALEFDHIKGKKEINMAFAKSINQAKREIEKCDVVCSNCHRVRTYNRIYPCKPDIFEATYEPVSEDS